MQEYIVDYHEDHIVTIKIKAESKEDAIERVLSGEGEEISSQYDSTIDDSFSAELLNKE